MKTTPVERLIAYKDWAMAGIFLFELLYAIVAVWARYSAAFIFISLVIFSIFFIYVMIKRYNKAVGKRLNYIATTLLDPELLQKEVSMVLRKASGDWKVKYAWWNYEAIRLNMLGDYEGALKACMKLPEAKEKKFADAKKLNIFFFSVRCGRLTEAGGMISEVTGICENNEDYKYMFHRILGEYYLETGHCDKARENLIVGMSTMKTKGSSQGMHFVLARLEEKEGNAHLANGHYKQAAAIGPKTWMGQEAARRAEALALES